jgi:hypothetical protein
LKIAGSHLPLFKEFSPNLGNVSSKPKEGIEIQKRISFFKSFCQIQKLVVLGDLEVLN